jgi:hypothetical protein
VNDQKLYDKILTRVRKDESGCWIWTGPSHKTRKYAANRYGYVSVYLEEKKKSRSLDVHRAMWRARYCPLPPTIEVCHKCDNPLCCNPDHLFLGTHKDNMADSKHKGRHYLSSKTHCKRGHPLSGDNLYVCPGQGLRDCLICHTARYRIKLGWPEHLAYTVGKIPSGYMLDRETWQVVSVRGRAKRKQVTVSGVE